MYDWGLINFETFQKFWQNFWGFLINLIIAIIVFLIGWLISGGVGRLVARFLKKLKIDLVLERSKGLKEALERAEIKIVPSQFIGEICKWILVIVFLMLAVDVLGWKGFAQILRDFINYLPNILVAILIFVVTVIIADIVEKVIVSAVAGMKVKYGPILGAVAKGAIWVLAIFAILSHLKIAKEIVLTLFQGIVAIIVIAGGIAFGLGGKEVATDILQDFRKKLKKE
jgi:hypothetical protein